MIFDKFLGEKFKKKTFSDTKKQIFEVYAKDPRSFLLQSKVAPSIFPKSKAFPSFLNFLPPKMIFIRKNQKWK